MGNSPRNRTSWISAPLRSARCVHPAQAQSPRTRLQRISPWKRAWDREYAESGLGVLL